MPSTASHAALIALIVLVGAASAAFKQSTLQLNTPTSGEWLYTSKTGKTAVVAPSSGGNAYVVNVATMTQLPTINGPSPTSGNSQGFVELTDNLVFISTSQGLMAFDVATGATNWTASSNLINAGGPAYNEKTDAVYVVSRADSKLYAFHASTGAPYFVTSETFAPKQPFVANGGSVLLLVDATSGSLVAIDATTGAKQWSIPDVKPWNTDSRLQAFNDGFSASVTVMLTQNNGQFYSVKLDTFFGQVSFKQPLVTPSWSATPNDVAIVGSAFNFWCYNGSQVVQQSQGDGSAMNTAKVNTSMSVSGLANLGKQTILSITPTKTIEMFSELTGSAQGSFTVDGNVIAAQNPVAHQSVVLLTDDNKVIVLTP